MLDQRLCCDSLLIVCSAWSTIVLRQQLADCVKIAIVWSTIVCWLRMLDQRLCCDSLLIVCSAWSMIVLRQQLANCVKIATVWSLTVCRLRMLDDCMKIAIVWSTIVCWLRMLDDCLQIAAAWSTFVCRLRQLNDCVQIANACWLCEDCDSLLNDFISTAYTRCWLQFNHWRLCTDCDISINDCVPRSLMPGGLNPHTLRSPSSIINSLSFARENNFRIQPPNHPLFTPGNRTQTQPLFRVNQNKLSFAQALGCLSQTEGNRI